MAAFSLSFFDPNRMPTLFDLHSHSLYSDGILRPQAVVSRAKAQGVTTLALTDHDTTQGIAEARVQAELEGIDLIAGIEFSCLWQGMNIHIVGLNIDLTASSLIAGEAQQQRARDERAITIAEKLDKAGLKGSYEGALALADGGVVGRPHFARYLVESGKVKSVAAAFKKYLGAGKVGDVKQVWPDIATAVQWITEAGGVAVVAHPDKYKLTRTKLKRLLVDFKEAGGLAMEVVSGRQQPQTSQDLGRIANEYGLYASCGSDFHVPDQPWQELGKYSPMPEGVRPVWEAWAV